jgi:hypothetical protein
MALRVTGGGAGYDRFMERFDESIKAAFPEHNTPSDIEAGLDTLIRLKVPECDGYASRRSRPRLRPYVCCCKAACVERSSSPKRRSGKSTGATSSRQPCSLEEHPRRLACFGT